MYLQIIVTYCSGYINHPIIEFLSGDQAVCLGGSIQASHIRYTSEGVA